MIVDNYCCLQGKGHRLRTCAGLEKVAPLPVLGFVPLLGVHCLDVVFHKAVLCFEKRIQTKRDAWCCPWPLRTASATGTANAKAKPSGHGLFDVAVPVLGDGSR